MTFWTTCFLTLSAQRTALAFCGPWVMFWLILLKLLQWTVFFGSLTPSDFSLLWRKCIWLQKCLQISDVIFRVLTEAENIKRCNTILIFGFLMSVFQHCPSTWETSCKPSDPEILRAKSLPQHLVSLFSLLALQLTGCSFSSPAFNTASLAFRIWTED